MRSTPDEEPGCPGHHSSCRKASTEVGVLILPTSAQALSTQCSMSQRSWERGGGEKTGSTRPPKDVSY